MVIPATFYELLKIFHLDMKPKVRGIESYSDFLFVTFKGEEMNPSVVNKAIKSAWSHFYGNKEDIGPMPFISSNILRRSFTTAAVTEGFTTEERRSLAHHMNHELSTADAFYECTKGKFNSIVAARLIQQMLFNNKPDEEEEGEGTEDDEDTDYNEANDEEGDDEDQVSHIVEEPTSTGSPRVTFTPQMNEIFERVTTAYLAQKKRDGSNISRKEVQGLFRSQPEKFNLLGTGPGKVSLNTLYYKCKNTKNRKGQPDVVQET